MHCNTYHGGLRVVNQTSIFIAEVAGELHVVKLLRRKVLVFIEEKLVNLFRGQPKEVKVQVACVFPFTSHGTKTTKDG